MTADHCDCASVCAIRAYVDGSGNEAEPGKGEWVCLKEARKRLVITSYYTANRQHGRVIGPFSR